MNEVITVNKPGGLTPLQAIERFKQKFPLYQNEKISYAGRLDPMASGLLVLLVGDKNKNRNEFEGLKKTYEFELLLGIETDTYDGLGIISHVYNSPTDYLTQVAKLLPLFIGVQDQPYPPYSAMHVAGKPLYYWAREGKLDEIQIPTKTITIDSLTIKQASEVSSSILSKRIIKVIGGVQGDFRQSNIIGLWEKFSMDHRNFPLISCTANVSSGTYIRSLAHEVGKRLGTGAIAYSIHRTKVGKHHLKDALEL